MRQFLTLLPVFALLLCIGAMPVCAQHAGSPLARYDLVISGGRVIDPETGLDSVLNVGVCGGTIRTISREHLEGRRTIDAAGLVVCPGFIDILSYDLVEPGVWTKLADGVTTNLAMHGGATDPDAWYRSAASQHPPIHYGASFFYNAARLKLAGDRYVRLKPIDREKLLARTEAALRKGALGISFSLEYVPGVTTDEIVPVMGLAAKYHVPVFFHARYSDMEQPGTNLDGLREIISCVRATGASAHIDHINSTGGTFSMKASIALLDSARDAGMDISACMYPYTYWGTYLNSARFDAGWQERFHISYNDLQLGGSTELMTSETFAKYRRQGKLVVAYAIPDEDNVRALQAPYVMIGSDAILEPGYNNHPRASGCFSRVFAVYVRDKHVLSLRDAIARMTILPAHRIEQSCEAMKRKGRVQVGADADIVVFDPATISDRATVAHPELTSTGIRYVLVSGSVVIDERGLHKSIRAGTPLRGATRPLQ
jgi:N-acyl-D-aspartate/D-glutamate deacylase